MAHLKDLIVNGSARILGKIMSPVFSDSVSMGRTEGSDIGISSTALGYEIIASGEYSHAEGAGTRATAQCSHAEGYFTIASGDYSHAEGSSAEASGDNSHAEGTGTIASGNNSHAEGAITEASGKYSHAEGTGTAASGEASHAEGYYTQSQGEYSHAEGSDTQAQGGYSHAEGSGTISQGEGSHAEGSNTTTYGAFSHAEGNYTVAQGDYSHAEGGNTASEGIGSHAEGLQTTASGSAAHAEGLNTTASNDYSHAEGDSAEASGYASHAEGFYTTATGEASHAEGVGTVASGPNQHVQGAYNISINDNTTIHIVGNGTSNEKRSNAHIIQNTGYAWFAGDVYVGSTSGTDWDTGSKKLATIDEALLKTGGTMTGNIIMDNTATTAQASEPYIQWQSVYGNNPYMGLAHDQTDGTFIICSMEKDTTEYGEKHYKNGLAIGGGSGNLFWKGKQVATTDMIVTNAVTTDTKNTTGTTDTSSKIYLAGATSQAANPQTYSHNTVYVDTDGHLYSNSKQAVNLSDTQALTNKTYNGYTLGAACAKGVVTSVASGNTNLVTSGGVYATTSTLAPKASPALTGTPTAPTVTTGTATDQIATTAFVNNTINDKITYGTTELVPGSSSLATGRIHIVYK